MSNSEIETEVQQWVELLRSKVQDDRLTAASQLGRLGVRTRGAVRTRGGVMTRGTLSAPATARMAQEHLSVALQALSDAQPDVRREVAFALGEWADEVAVRVLAELARQDDDWRVRTASADALAKIGGSEAVTVLQTIARDDAHEDVRASAISGLGNLALASVTEPSRATPVRTRGAVRTRGSARQPSAHIIRRAYPEVAHILELLEEIRKIDSSDFVRNLADSTLAGLGE